MINQIIDWFKIAKPQPTDKDICTQIGCHFEEVAEMEGALFKHSAISGKGTNVSQAEFYKTIENAEGLLSFVDKKDLLDALCDQIVTAVGVGYMMGFDMEGALAEVIRSNHSKFEQGKALFDDNGVLVDDVDCDMPDQYLTIDEVKILATDLTEEIINECEADIIDLSKSTLKIELLQTKTK